jgi:arginyl-tRNA--protein-N-Asp/Glu arginylyltransferase
MNILSTVMLGGALTLVSFAGFAADSVKHTSMTENWMCTTNASSASNDKDKAADDRLADKTKLQSGDAAFKMAAENCRDCTKITCEQKTP